MLKISANAHARENCTCNFSIAQKITDFVSKLLILSFIITGLCSGKLASLTYRFKALPFGLRPAPRLFTRLVACVAASSDSEA